MCEKTCRNCKRTRFVIAQDKSICLDEKATENMNHALLGQKVFVGEFRKEQADVAICDHPDNFIQDNN